MLRLSFDKEADKLGRAGQLRERIMNVRRILVILDDVWARLNLRTVGIPHGDEHKGCKILLTTRKKDVCNVMLVNKDKVIPVKLLSEEESWALFKQNAGDGINYLPLKKVAEDVMNECKGLPIALVTVGRALREKDLVEWADAMLRLKNSKAILIEGVDKAVVSCLKLSYDNLPDIDTRLCFLFCCLFPKEHDIEIEDIVRYVVGKGLLFSILETIAEVRTLVHTTIKKLKTSCLLLEGKFVDGVKMHGMVHGVAISIASEENCRWLDDISALGTLKEPETLSLAGSGIKVLPLEVGELTSSRLLDLSRCVFLEMVPANVISRLSRLEELCMRDSFDNWEVVRYM